MSSKGRKKKGNESEFFPTPKWCTHRYIEAAKLPGGSWLEPCAGDGAIIEAVNEIRPSGITWTANELMPQFDPSLRRLTNNVTISNFLEWDSDPTGPRPYDVIITNPPFSLAFQIIKKSLELSDYVAMLLRLNFIGSNERSDFFRTMMPNINVIPERPSFDGYGADSIEYAWMQWNQPAQRNQTQGTITLLGSTPLKIRREHKPAKTKLIAA